MTKGGEDEGKTAHFGAGRETAKIKLDNPTGRGYNNIR